MNSESISRRIKLRTNGLLIAVPTKITATGN